MKFLVLSLEGDLIALSRPAQVTLRREGEVCTSTKALKGFTSGKPCGIIDFSQEYMLRRSVVTS